MMQFLMSALNQVATFFKEASEAGAKGLAYIRVREDGEIDTIGAIKDNLNEEQKQEILQSHRCKSWTFVTIWRLVMQLLLIKL